MGKAHLIAIAAALVLAIIGGVAIYFAEYFLDSVTGLIVLALIAIALVLLIIIALNILIPSFFTAHVNSINAFIYTSGAIVALMGLLFTGAQIRDASKQLEAATVYSIQGDFRELYASAMASPEYREYVLNFDANSKYDKTTVEVARRHIAQFLQLYSAMFISRTYGVVSEEAWKIALRDLCSQLGQEPVQRAWQDRYKAAYEEAVPEFVSEVETC